LEKNQLLYANCKPKQGKTDFQILCYVLVKYVNVTITKQRSCFYSFITKNGP